MSEKHTFKNATHWLDGGICILVCALYPVVWHWFKFVAQMPEEAYHTSILIDDLFKRLLSQKRILLPIGLAGFVFWRHIPWAWPDQHNWKLIRLFVLTGAGCLTLSSTFYGFNFWYEQSHGLDRIVLLLMFIVLFRSPVALLPWLLMTLMIKGQFLYPIGGISLTDKLLPLNQCGAVMTGLWVPMFVRDAARSGRVLLSILLAVLAAHYWLPAWEKVSIGWLQNPERHNLMFGAAESGWLWWMSDRLVTDICRVLKPIDLASTWLTLIVEFGVIVVLLGSRLRRVALISAILLHLGIFFLSGILFWEWVVVNITFIVCSCRIPRLPSPLCVCALFSVVAMPASFGAPALGWFDSNLTHVFRVCQTDALGEGHVISPSDLHPYDVLFAKQRFGFVSGKPEVTSTFGTVTDAELFQEIGTINSANEMGTLISERGNRVVDRERSEKMRRLLLAYAKSSGRELSFWDLRLIPDHIWQIHDLPETEIRRVPRNQIVVWEQSVFRSIDARYSAPAEIVLEVQIPEDNEAGIR